MPRRRKGPRLWLRERAGREPVYVILDGKKEIGTGCGVDDFGRAEKAFAEYIAKAFRPNTKERDLSRISVAEVLTMYGKDQPATKPSRALIGYHIANLIPFWGDKTLDEVRGSSCRKYGEARASVKASTVRRELKTLQAAINHWHKESPLAAVPKVTLPQEGERRERVLERSEVARMLWAARKLKLPHVARFILIGIYTGTRHAAVLNLRWNASLNGGHFDSDRGVIFRRGSAERDTSKRRPPVLLPIGLHRRMARWKRMDGEEISHVVHYRGTRVLKMKRAWTSVVKEAGLGKDVTPHTLRHTCASWLLWQGKTVWDVAGIIGADATTVQKIYGHHRLAVDLKRAANDWP